MPQETMSTAMAEQGKIIRIGGGGNTAETEPIHKQCVSSNDLSSCFCFISELPDSILKEIFLMLPIKYVVRCASVCKEWHRIISESDFSDCFVKNSNFRPLLYDYYLSGTSSFSPRVLFLLEISDNGYDCIRTVIDPQKHDWLRNHEFFFVQGFCNGFILMVCGYYLKRYSDIYVTNPVTGESIKLPKRKGDYQKNPHSFQEYCIGFSPFDKKFKVLGIDADGLVKDAEIVTVGVDDKWRSLSSDIFKGLEISFDGIIYCSGTFHWIPCHYHKNLGYISAFDLCDELLSQFPLPPGLEGRTSLELRTFDDKLCVVDRKGPCSITIWVIKEHAEPDSWTAILISRSWIPPEMKSYSFNPIARLRDGEILFADRRNNYLMSFNVKENKFSRVDMYVPNSRPDDVKTCALNCFHPAKKV